jgi:predicted transcriptional regulator of viral defense system
VAIQWHQACSKRRYKSKKQVDRQLSATFAPGPVRGVRARSPGGVWPHLPLADPSRLCRSWHKALRTLAYGVATGFGYTRCWKTSVFGAASEMPRYNICGPNWVQSLSMADVTLARLGSIAERRWGLVTTAQAEDAGVSRKQLSRMASTGAIERVAQGVYRMAGAPPMEQESIYATWLALGGGTAPRTDAGVAPIVAAGITAAAVHGIGDFLLDGFDFIVPSRKGSRLPGVRLRIRSLSREEVIPVDALPTLTVERTIADLVDIGTDLSLVAGALRDAVRADKLVAPERLVSYLSPIAARRKRDGRALASGLFELADVAPEGWSHD